MQSDATYMSRALALAARGRGWTSPNPMVGCVIVRDGIVIGEGWHQRVGGPHAEVNAYAACGDADTAGACVYVTLEPCAHVGRTPPCVDLLLERRPGRVVVAMRDPNPKVTGGGIERLRDAGIRVDVGVLEAEALRLNEIFVKNMRTGLPWVTAKCAMTLDGKIATRSGNSKWVTGEAARLMTHHMRHAHDAILVGSRTVMLDDPSLTTRLPEGGRNPVRVILDAENYLTGDRAVFAEGRQGPTWVATSDATDYPFADDVLRLPPGPGGVDMKALVCELAARGITSLLIEGGGATLAAAFEAGIVDKVCFFCAPKITGGCEAVTPVEGRGSETMDQSIALDSLRAIPVGEDVLMEAYVRKGPDGNRVD